MPEPGTPPDAPPPPPRGMPEFVRFDGILEGPCRRPAALRQACKALDGIGVVKAELDVDGGRFSMLLDDLPVPGDRFGAARREDFAAALQGVIEAAGEQVESTLRCVAVYEEEVVETLFACRLGKLEAVSRARTRGPEDRPAVPTQAPRDLPKFSRRQALILGGLLVVFTVVLSWKNGYVDRLLAHEAEGMEVSPGAFGDLLEVEVESRWGNYEIEIRRGEGYPATAEQEREREEAAASTEERAAVRAVLAGDYVYVRLENDDGDVLSSTKVELRNLLSEDDGMVEAELPGSMAARRITVALDSGDE